MKNKSVQKRVFYMEKCSMRNKGRQTLHASMLFSLTTSHAHLLLRSKKPATLGRPEVVYNNNLDTPTQLQALLPHGYCEKN